METIDNNAPAANEPEPPAFFKRKTTWTAFGGILAAIIAAKTGQITTPEAITVTFQSLLALALRSAIARGQ